MTAWSAHGCVLVRTFSGGLHAAGDVDRIAKETVSRHRDSDHSADHRSTVQAAADHQLTIRTMTDLYYTHMHDTDRLSLYLMLCPSHGSMQHNEKEKRNRYACVCVCLLLFHMGLDA